MRGRIKDFRMRRPVRIASIAALRDDDVFPFRRRSGGRSRRRW
jgi:hypothetical protein